MKVMKLFLICALYFSLCGYIFFQDQPDSYYLEKLNQAQGSVQITLDASYAEAFRATLDVLRDFNINIVKKGYDAKTILGAYYIGDCYAVYGIFFEEGPEGKTNLTVKASGKCFSAEFIFNRIIAEVKVQKGLR